MDQALKFEQLLCSELPEALSFSVPSGSVTAVITSRQDDNDLMVRLLLGLAQPEAGSVTTLGVDLGAAAEKELVDLRRRVAVVHPSGGLISNLKVWENLVLPLEYYASLSPAEIEGKGLKALRRVGFSGGLFELPAHLSLYEKRLVGLARAMLTQPRLVVYNAILAGVRGGERSAIVDAALEFHREDPQRTSLFVTANPETVAEIPFDCRIFLNGSTHDN